MYATKCGFYIKFYIHATGNGNKVGTISSSTELLYSKKVWLEIMFVSSASLMTMKEGTFTFILLKAASMTWKIVGSWTWMELSMKPINWPSMSLSVVSAGLKNYVMEWMICTLLDFSSMWQNSVVTIWLHWPFFVVTYIYLFTIICCKSYWVHLNHSLFRIIYL